MNVTEQSQVVRAPDEPWDDRIEARIKELILALPEIRPLSIIKLAAGRLIHPLGMHTWVRHKRYDDISDRLIDVGLVCWWCPTGRRG